MCIHIKIFCVMTLCGLVGGIQRVGVIYRPILQGFKCALNVKVGWSKWEECDLFYLNIPWNPKILHNDPSFYVQGFMPFSLKSFPIYTIQFVPVISTPFGWLNCIYLILFLWEYHFWFTPFSCTATFSVTEGGRKRRTGSLCLNFKDNTCEICVTAVSTVCLAGPLYRMHCSSTVSGVANMYSFSNPTNLAATPLDAAVASARLLVDLDPVVSPHSLVPSESRTSMPRGHTFSRESRPIAVDLNISELGEMSDRVPATRTGLLSPEPPPPYNSTRDEQRPESAVQILRWVVP